MTCTDLAKRLSVTECVAEYQAAIADIKAACATIAAAEERLNNAFTLGDTGGLHLSVHDRVRFEDPSRNLEELRRSVWGTVIERTEVRRMLSTKRARELDDMLKSGVLPEITVESVESLVASFAGQLPELLEEAVQEVFDFLRPTRGEFKTNSQLEIGPKVILSSPIERGFCDRYDVSHWWESRITALENVFTALDGKGQMTKSYYSALSYAIKSTPVSGDGRGETDYFRFRCCRKGTLHLEFRRLDLLGQLNRVAGGARLRPAPKASSEPRGDG